MRHALRLGALILIAFALLPPNVAAADSVTVTPSTDLVEGQIISIVGTPDPGSLAISAAATCAPAGFGSVHCAGMGQAVLEPPEYVEPAIRFVQTSSGLVDCAVEQCQVGVDVGQITGPFGMTEILYSAYTDVSFQPIRAIRARTSSLVGPGQSDVVASFLQAPTGSGALVMRCAVLNGQFACGDLGSVEFDFDGNFTGQVPNGPTFDAGVGTADCRATACGIVVAVLGPNLKVVDVMSLFDPNWPIPT